MSDRIILLIGVDGSGKDTYANELLITQKRAVKLGFSDGVRQKTWEAISWEPKDSNQYEEFKQREFIDEELGIKFKGRDLMVNIAEKIIKVIDKKFFAKLWVSNCNKKFLGFYTVIGYDLRFDFEFEEAYRFCEWNNVKLKVILCDYRSERYNAVKDETNSLALELIENGFKDKDDVTSYLIKKYGKI